MKLFEHHKTERTLDRLPELPSDVEVPDDISGLPTPTTPKPTAGGVRWMRWLAAIVVLGAVGVLAAVLLSSSDPDPVPAEDYMATYGTDNPAIVDEGAVAGTVEIAGTADYMTTYGTDNPAIVGEAQYLELYGTDNPVFVPGTLYMELYGTDNPAFVGEAQYLELYGTDNPVFSVVVPGAAFADTVDTGQYMELYGTDNPAFVGEARYMELHGTDNPVFPVVVPGAAFADTGDSGQYMELYGTDNPVFVWAFPTEGPGSNSLAP